MSEQNSQFPPLGRPPVTRKKSHALPILITICCGFLLGLGSCFGFLSTLNINGPATPLNILLGCGFVVGVLLFTAGTIWAIVAIIVHFLSHRRDGL